jgi:hypothetical protein
VSIFWLCIVLSVYVCFIYTCIFGIALLAHNLSIQTGDCFDGIKNQDETGVDCGGVCAKKCGLDVVAVIVGTNGTAGVRAAFANGDVTGHLNEISVFEFNTLMASGAAALRHNFATVVVRCCLSTSPSLDWNINVLPYLALGGSLLVEVVGTQLAQLSPGIVAGNVTLFYNYVRLLPSAK